MKIRLFVFLTLFSGLSLGLYAQVAADPLDFFYNDLNVWETSGLINNLPAARPYPLVMVKSILNTVIEKGDATQRKIAEEHYHRFFGRILTYGGKSEAGIETAHSLKQLGIALSFDLNYELEDFLSISATIDGWATNKLFDQELLPLGQKSSKDTIQDNAKVSVFWIQPSVDSSLALGNTEYYLNAGVMRGSYGPFPNNGLIVGSQSLHSAQYSMAVNKPLWGYNVSLYGLSANNGYGRIYSTDDTVDTWPSKYLSVHSFDFRPYEWLSVSFLESVMYGGRIEPMYMLPMSPFMVSQGLTGYNDNSYIGGMFTVKPIKGLKIDGVLYADDLSFNDIVKLHWDTKWRLGGQLGASYAPRKPGKLTMVSFDYTMITPYTYSHKSDDTLSLKDPNYQNYMHAGNSFGAALDPNSDRINLNIKLRPLEDMEFNVVGVLIRHGNVNENMEKKFIKEYLTNDKMYITDGSILNSSGTNAGHAFNYSTPFLTQDSIQYIWQTGIDALCRLPVLKTGGYMVFRFSYRVECNINPNVGTPVYHYDSDLVTHSLESDYEDQVDAAAKAQLSDWKAALGKTEYNSYLRVGFEYYY